MKKKSKQNGWSISIGVFYLIVMASMILAYYIIIPPLDAHVILGIIEIIAFIWFKRQDRISKFSLLDGILIILGTIGFLAAVIYLSISALSSISWLSLILIGMSADIIGSTLGAVPIVGDFLSAFITIMIVVITLHSPIIGFIAATMGIIALIPGPTFGAQTLFLIIFKLIITAFGG